MLDKLPPAKASRNLSNIFNKALAENQKIIKIPRGFSLNCAKAIRILIFLSLFG